MSVAYHFSQGSATYKNIDSRIKMVKRLIMLFIVSLT